LIRTLHPELVDELPAHHPGAIQTRRDLRRINTLMGHAPILSRALKTAFPGRAPQRLVEIGAGDGDILLRVARRLSSSWRDVDLTLVDLQDLLDAGTKKEFAAVGWRARSIESDVFDWLDAAEKSDAILANLVLHHFTEAQLMKLLSAASQKTDVFIALEPRRAGWPLFCANWLSLIGFSPVTCHDAPVSVRAGFRDQELSALWPRGNNWKLTERSTGLFSHLFVAQRKG
jgi:hypothetical protein